MGDRHHPVMAVIITFKVMASLLQNPYTLYVVSLFSLKKYENTPELIRILKNTFGFNDDDDDDDSRCRCRCRDFSDTTDANFE